MEDKVIAAGKKPQPEGSSSQGQLDLTKLLKAVTPLPGLRTYVRPLQIPFGLQYQGSSPRKHIKGNSAGNKPAVSCRGLTSVVGTVYGKISKPVRSTILASANPAATLSTQIDNNNNSNKHNAILGITRTVPSPGPQSTAKRARTMENLDLLNDRTPSAEPQEQGLPSFQSFVSTNAPSPGPWESDIIMSTESMALSSSLNWNDVLRLQNEVQLLRSNNELQEQEMSRFRTYIAELAGFNENIHKYLGSLHNRLQVLEVDIVRYREAFGTLDDHVYPRSPTVSRAGMSTTYCNNSIHRMGSLSPESEEGFVHMGSDEYHAFDGAQHVGDVDKQILQTTLNGLPTPTHTNGPPTARFDFKNLPPLIRSTQPKATTVTAVRKPTTMLAKRSVHNLSKTMAPATTQMPQMPLTNVELIVYFFNSISRPVVALRLYAQNEGPASITAILNEHRNTKPPYLRNTCSVKCVTAIRRGKELYGPQWELQYRAMFVDAMEMQDKESGLLKATELIRIPEEESEDATDIDVLELLRGLSKHPQENDGRGWFTSCVEYCEENRLHWPLSEIHVLAAELHAGRRPQAYGAQLDDDFDMTLNDVCSKIKSEVPSPQEVVATIESDSVIELSDTDADTVVDIDLHAGYSPGGKENGEPDEVEDYDAVVEDV